MTTLVKPLLFGMVYLVKPSPFWWFFFFVCPFLLNVQYEIWLKNVSLIKITNSNNHLFFMFHAFSQSEHPLWLMWPFWSSRTFFKFMISCSEKQFFCFYKHLNFQNAHYFLQIFIMIPYKYHNKKWMKCWFLHCGMPLAQTL